MRSVLVTVLIVLMIPALVQGAVCTPKDVLQQYLTEKHADHDAQVLAFNHVEKRLVVYDWKKPDLPDAKTPLERLETDRPLLRRDDRTLIVVVMNTNPVVFRVAQTESAQVDSASLEAIKKFLAAFSGFTVTTVTQVAQRTIDERKDAISRSRPESGRRSADDLVNDVVALSVALEKASKRVAPAYAPLKGAADKLKGYINTTDDVGTRLTAYAQLVELGDQNAKRPMTDVSTLPQDIATALENIETALSAAELAPCVDIVSALGRAIRLRLEGYSSSNPVEGNRARDEYDQLVAKLITAKCNDDREIEKWVLEIATWLKDSPIEPDPPAREIREVLLVAEALINDYKEFATSLAKMKETAGELLKQRQSAILNASSLKLVTERVNAIPYIDSDPCAAITGVLEVPRLRDSTTKLAFGREGNETFKITLDKPFDKLSLKHADLDQKYALARRSWIDPDVDVALTYTRLVEPTFALVDEVDENPADTIPPKKFIRRTKEDTRAGQLAMMLTARFPSFPVTKYIAPQLGFLISTGNPGAFAGLAVRLGPYVKVSAGTTYQKVTKLRRGFVEDNELPAGKTAIETRSGFDHGGYLALSITLDNLPFFKAP